MALWKDRKLFDRLLEMLEQKERGMLRFNNARDTIADYVRLDLGCETEPDGDGTFFGENIYEGTPSWAARVMSTGFQGNLVSAQADWIKYAMARFELLGNDDLDLWLQDVKEHMTAAYRKSNLYTVLPMFTLDGVTIGSPVMFEEEDVLDGTIGFFPQHYKTVFLFYDKRNRPEGVIIKDERWTTKQIFDKFAKTHDEAKRKFSVGLNNQIDQGLFNSEHTIIRAVFKRDNPVFDDLEGFKKPVKEWISMYFEENVKDDMKNEPLLTEDYFVRPFVVWDFDKKSWESSSRTPAFEAIHDVVSLQQVHKNLLENYQLKNRPPMATLPDYRHSLNLGPEGINVIQSQDWDKMPKAIDIIGDINQNKDLSDQIAASVKRWFHTDAFLKFTDLVNKLKQQPTATQIIKMDAEGAVQLNPAIGTYTDGFLKSVDDIAINIESRAGRGPFAKDVMENIQDIIVNKLQENVSAVEIGPVFIGPLARAQKVKQELDPILDGLGAAEVLFAAYPDLRNAIREYGTLEDLLKATNFPLKNLVPEEEYDDVIARLNQVRQQQQEQALALEMAKVAPNVSKNVEPNSILAAAAGGGG